MRSADHVELKAANLEYTNCVASKFLPGWLKGETLQVNEVCGAQYESMMEKNATVYGEKPMPFQPLRLPQ